MDNDFFVKKIFASAYKKLRFELEYYNIRILFDDSANEVIKNKIISGLPISISRLGAIEMRCIDYYLRKKKYDESIKKMININAGIFPATDEILDKFCDFYLESSKNIDILALWEVRSEKRVIKEYCKNTEFINLRGLEPYYFTNPWSEALKGKKVLIIHPFKQSITEQYNNRKLLFKDLNVLPTFKSLEVIKAVQSNAGGKTEFIDWFEAYNFMCNQIIKKDFDLAIIGAGAYGLPLASFVKSIGKQAIHMAGATQILFGIQGRRWDKHPIISKLYNENWIRPNTSEKPEKANQVEGGSYW